MAEYYTEVSNSRGKTVAVSGRKDGQGAHIRTWTHGVKVYAQDGKFQIYMTGGSNGHHSDTYLGTVVLTPDGKTKFIV